MKVKEQRMWICFLIGAILSNITYGTLTFWNITYPLGLTLGVVFFSVGVSCYVSKAVDQ